MIAPSLQTEGKALQTSQGVGMGSRGAAREVNMPTSASATSPDGEAEGVFEGESDHGKVEALVSGA